MDRDKKEEIIAQFIKERSVDSVSSKCNVDREVVVEVVEENKLLVNEILTDMDKIKIIRDGEGKIDGEEMVVQICSLALGILKDSATAMEPLEKLKVLEEVRRQMELTSKTQGKINSSGEGNSLIEASDFKQYLIKNLTVINNKQFKKERIQDVVGEKEIQEGNFVEEDNK